MITLKKCLEAFKHLKEIDGIASNPLLLAILKKYFPDTTDDSKLAWCSIIIMEALSTNGYDIKGATPMARSWLKVGKRTENPTPGNSLVIFWRGTTDNGINGHVGIYMGETKVYTYTYGGNQNNQVNLSPYPKEQVLGYVDVFLTDKKMKEELQYLL